MLPNITSMSTHPCLLASSTVYVCVLGSTHPVCVVQQQVMEHRTVQRLQVWHFAAPQIHLSQPLHVHAGIHCDHTTLSTHAIIMAHDDVPAFVEYASAPCIRCSTLVKLTCLYTTLLAVVRGITRSCSVWIINKSIPANNTASHMVCAHHAATPTKVF